jgi:hypothetical protein
MNWISENTDLLIALALGLIVLSGGKDGLSERGRVDESKPDSKRVGWQPWHLFGILARVLVQLILASILASRYDVWYLQAAVYLVLWAHAYYSHRALYNYCYENREKFLWGQKKPQWWQWLDNVLDFWNIFKRG